MDIEALHTRFNATELYGRYVTLTDIEPLIKKFQSFGQVEIIGNSVLGKPLYLCKAGTGKTKILMWSQMHGNESTTTKALFDFLNLLQSGDTIAKKFLDFFTLYMVPMLNPDGALLYTRENANETDLNRDFCDLTQPESQALFGLFQKIGPDFCFNLHDQRTIYAAGNSGKPATVSFLAPSYNEQREFNPSRNKAVSLIVSMNEALQRFIPGQVGRFDDSFNINCAGDTFQSHQIPTVLFEAGHYPGDYQREMTRKLVFIALVSGLKHQLENVIVGNRITDYLNIPQNIVGFYDFVYKNVKINYDGIEKITNFGAQFREELKDGKIVFTAYVAEVGFDDGIFGHVTIDAENQLYRDNADNIPEPDQKADFYLGNTRFVNGEKLGDSFPI